jgi:hypothetical protein
MAERAAKKPNRSGRVPLRVQVEPELLERLKGVAEREYRSVTSEVRIRLRDSLVRDEMAGLVTAVSAS